MGTVPAKNRCFEKYILKYPFRFSGKVRKSWSRTHRSRMLTFGNVDFWNNSLVTTPNFRIVLGVVEMSIIRQSPKSNVLEYSRLSFYYTKCSSRPHLVSHFTTCIVTKCGHGPPSAWPDPILLHKMSSRPHHVLDKYTWKSILLHKNTQNHTVSTDLVTKISGLFQKT